MGPADARVWTAALRLGLVAFDRYEYDVRLGGTGAADVDGSHELFPMWETLLRKRVDVVAWIAQRPTLIEVKPVANFAALGQCLGYLALWKKEKPTPIGVGVMCVCAVGDPDLMPIFASYGVSVVTLPEHEALRALGHRSSAQE